MKQLDADVKIVEGCEADVKEASAKETTSKETDTKEIASKEESDKETTTKHVAETADKEESETKEDTEKTVKSETASKESEAKEAAQAKKYVDQGSNLDCSGFDLQTCYGYGQYSIPGQGTYDFCAKSCDNCSGCTGFGISNNGCWLKKTTSTHGLTNSKCYIKM
jgi:ribosomal protein L14E/L6E/L27E